MAGEYDASIGSIFFLWWVQWVLTRFSPFCFFCFSCQLLFFFSAFLLVCGLSLFCFFASPFPYYFLSIGECFTGCTIRWPSCLFLDCFPRSIASSIPSILSSPFWGIISTHIALQRHLQGAFGLQLRLWVVWIACIPAPRANLFHTTFCIIQRAKNRTWGIWRFPKVAWKC